MSDFMWKVGYAAPEMCEACFVKIGREDIDKVILKFRDVAVIGNRVLKHLKNLKLTKKKFFGLFEEKVDAWTHCIQEAKSHYSAIVTPERVAKMEGLINSTEFECLKAALDSYPKCLKHLDKYVEKDGEMYLTLNAYYEMQEILNLDLTLVSTEYTIGIRV
ncbi:hypothetical protein bas53_0072 [Escherichia phage JohannBauhin]|nr:hypothetical protein bas53_0072 [Escherichia phage JohannBauhin]